MVRKIDRRKFIATTGIGGFAALAGCIGDDAVDDEDEDDAVDDEAADDTDDAVDDEDDEDDEMADDADDEEDDAVDDEEEEEDDADDEEDDVDEDEEDDDEEDDEEEEELDEDEFEEAEPEEGGEVVSWHAGGTGGTYFPLSGEFKSIVEANTPHALQVQSTGASVANVGALEREEADFALIQNDIAYFAFEGTGLEEFEGAPVENIRGVATLYPETIHVITPGDSEVESIEDLEGQSVNTGDLGSGTQVNALQILETAGIEEGDFDEENADFATAADQIRDGDIDAAFVVGGAPVGAVEELATTEEIGLVEIDGDLREDIKDDAQWMADDTVEGGTYDGIDDDVETVSVQAMIATHEGVEEGVVEEITEAIFDNTDDLTIESDSISTDTAQDGMPIDLHPGAEAYFG